MAVDLLLTTGNGPVECRIALVALIGEIEAAARQAGCGLEVARGPAPDRHGPKSAVLTIDGEGAQAIARAFEGTNQFVFKSPVRLGHKRQNWFVSVSRIEEAEDGAEDLDLRDLRFETLRAGGPGGQHQNTTDSAVRAVHVPTGLTVLARNERSQHRNRATALSRLGLLLRMLADDAIADRKSERFRSNRDLERGNPVRRFRL